MALPLTVKTETVLVLRLPFHHAPQAVPTVQGTEEAVLLTVRDSSLEAPSDPEMTTTTTATVTTHDDPGYSMKILRIIDVDLESPTEI
jgi:hypothetical protein